MKKDLQETSEAQCVPTCHGNPNDPNAESISDGQCFGRRHVGNVRKVMLHFCHEGPG